MSGPGGGRGRAALGAGLAAALAALASLTAPAAVAAASHAPRPAVISLRLSKSSLAAAGGTISLTASVRHATKCTFASTPRLRGLPAMPKCSAGRATEKVRLPANTSDAARAYKFSVRATGPGGTSAPRYATAHVLPPQPTAIVTVAPDGLPPAGGQVTLNITVRRAASCVLSSTPAVAGLPVTRRCLAGTSNASLSQTVNLPALTGSVAQRYQFTLKVTGPGGTASSTASETVWPTMTFGQPAAADPPEGYPGSLSCASANDCVATDDFGNAVRWNGTGWSAPERIFQLPAGQTSPMLTAISCPTTSFCAAVAQNEAMAVYDGSSWSAGPSTGIAATAISCASANLCAAVGGGYLAVYSSGTWAATAPTTGSGSPESVSCAPGTTTCVAATSGGSAYTYDGSSWGTATAFDASTDPWPVVSCASQDFCVAVDGSQVDDSGDAYTYDGTSWTGPVPVSSGAGTGLTSVSCPSSAYCLATADDGDYYTLTGGTWSGPQSGIIASSASCWAQAACGTLGNDGGVNILTSGTWGFSVTPLQPQGFTTAVSCPTASFCAAADQTGSVAFYDGSRWDVHGPSITPVGVGLVSISCPSPTFCMAADDDGGEYGSAAYTWNGSYWSGSLPGLFLTSVSCTSATFCMALGTLPAGVYASAWNGKSWAAPATKIDSPAAGAQVSCASPDFCAAVDANGNAMTFNGQSWSAPDAIDPRVAQPLSTVSCPAATFCTAMDGFGQAFTYSAAGWSGPVGVENSAGVTSVSCTSPAFCVAVDLTGNVVTEYNGTWSAPVNVDPQSDSNDYGFVAVSCATVAFCAATDFDGNVSLGTG